MNRIIQSIRSHPARFYLVLFILLIIPALVLYPLAESGSQIGMALFLALIILANAAALFF
jgi:NADH:ubiquinone oxidoreductase subunit 3 (subunit A)